MFNARNDDSTTFQLMIAAREWSPAEHETQVWGRIEIEEVILFFHLVQFPINATNKGFFFATDLYPSQISDTSPYHSLTPKGEDKAQSRDMA